MNHCESSSLLSGDSLLAGDHHGPRCSVLVTSGMLLLQLEFKRVHLTVVHRHCLTLYASSCSSCSMCLQSPWVRIKWTWFARSAIALLCFSLQWLIRSVPLCGSRHFTHGYIKPVGCRLRATYRVCVSVHDSLMKNWRALSWTIGWPAISVPSFSFSPPAFILLSWHHLSQHGVQIRKANLIWSHDRANPSQLQNERPFGVNPFQGPQWKASLRCRALSSSDSARIWWKGTRESSEA